MQININGTAATISAGQTVADILKQHDLEPDAVVVELNEAIVQAEDYSKTVLSENDQLELLSFVGGG